MPLFHFNILDGTDNRDVEGTDLVDIRAARREVRRYAAELLADSATSPEPVSEWHIEVIEALGRVLFRLDITMADVEPAPN